MRISRGFLVLAIFAGLPIAEGQSAQPAQSAQSAQPAAPNLSITISTPDEVVKAGSEVKVKVLFTNSSDQVISMSHTLAPNPGEVDNWIDVRDENGKLAPQTQYGKKIKGDESTPPAATNASSMAVEMKPGETARAHIQVTKLFDLSRPGKYTIQVDRFDRLENGSGAWAKSNIITVTVIP
jgi:hypothetical protein